MKTRHQRIWLMAVTVRSPPRPGPRRARRESRSKIARRRSLRRCRPPTRITPRSSTAWINFTSCWIRWRSVDTTDPPATAAPGLATRDSIRQAACETDTAFLGAVTEATSHPTRDGLFLWTSYRVRIVKSLRSRTGAMPQTGIVAVAPPTGIITVVRPGGSMVIEGMTVAARSNSYPPLEVGEQDHFFASFLDKRGRRQQQPQRGVSRRREVRPSARSDVRRAAQDRHSRRRVRSVAARAHMRALGAFHSPPM